MKKIFALILLLSTVLLSFTSCLRLIGFEDDEYIFMEDTSTITAIEIVKITEIVYFEDNINDFGYKMEILASISNLSVFLDEFSYLYCFTFNILPPIPIAEDEIGIKITYSSGNHEIIGSYGQAYYRSGIYSTTDKKLYFSDEDFNKFIDLYLASQNNSTI